MLGRYGVELTVRALARCERDGPMGLVGLGTVEFVDAVDAVDAVGAVDGWGACPAGPDAFY